MASAAITVVENPATIEGDTSEAVITKGLANMKGYLTNAGTSDTFLKVSLTDTAASGVATTNAQAQLIVPLIAGATIEILRSYKSIAHKMAAGTTTLAWFPAFGDND
mgnify:CR=1 FL=1